MTEEAWQARMKAAVAQMRDLREGNDVWKEGQRRKYAHKAKDLFEVESARLKKQYEDDAVAMRSKPDARQAVREDRAVALAAALGQVRTDLHNKH